ncbi:MAG: nucleotide sugar dehydrogenase [Lachnospiraceae bacterium]|nr:nucleotide sugar dehydrogenase [Lachnospiraceae bacterium]MDE6980114.1 nucleotide sugar dehydrogenase [Lachnospiraceae bacterium]
MFEKEKKLVCIQGMGFVGAAMAVAVASAKDKEGQPIYNVMGIELPNEKGKAIVKKICNGKFPFENVDKDLQKAHRECIDNKNLSATVDTDWFQKADIILSDINLDVSYRDNGEPYLDLEMYKNAIHMIGSKMKKGTLLIVETTVPPGTCENVIKPILEEEFGKRGLDKQEVLIAHSYERVMPGADYFNSIVNYWRVYSGINEKSAEMCEKLLSNIINTKKFPLTRLSCTTASEAAKVLENSYRAVTIAFMEEWGRFAENAGFDLFEVVDAIRKRPTHSNMRQPGFGVGGYCLTKDPYFAALGAKDILKLQGLEFPFCYEAVRMNNHMPIVSLDKIQHLLGGSLQGKRILVLGVSYRQDVGDTRYSPTEIFAREAMHRGAELTYQDPLVNVWSEMGVPVEKDIPSAELFDVIVFTVGHKQYSSINFKKWLSNKNLVFDANHVLAREQINDIREAGCRFSAIGMGGIG